MTDDPTGPESDADLIAAVERYLHAVGLAPTDPATPADPLFLTDVLIVTVRRGFDHRGSKSQTSVFTPTDSSVPMLIGMARYASMRFEGMASDSFRPQGDE